MAKRVIRPKAPSSRPPMARILRIHEELRNGTYPNCRRLAEALEVNPKTVQRDVDFMRYSMDLPIEYHAEKYGFHYTQPVDAFPLLRVTEGELVALLVARKALVQYRGTPFEPTLRGAFKRLADSLTDEVTVSWEGIDAAISFRAVGIPAAQDAGLFSIVSRGVVERRELSFEYKKLNSSVYEARRVHPYHLGCFANQWYLFAYDLKRDGIRKFVLGRMRKPRLSSRRFKRPAGFSAGEHLQKSFGIFRGTGDYAVRVRFDAFAAQLVRERVWHPSQRITELPGGRLELSLRVNSLFEVESWVLSFGAHAQVVAPPDFVQKIRNMVRQMAGVYESSEGLTSHA